MKPENIGNRVICIACKTEFCWYCLNSWHSNKICPLIENKN